MLILVSFATLIVLLLSLLLKGIFSPKLGLPLILLAISFLFFFNSSSKIQEPLAIKEELISKPETRHNSDKKEIIKEPPTITSAPKEESQKAFSQKEKEVKKYLTTVRVKGITNQSTLKQFSKKSGYNISKKGDYLLEFTYTGNSKQSSKPTENNRFVFSGGHLIVKVNEEKCCCAKQISLPSNLPLGKTMKIANQTLSEAIESYVSDNLDIIIPMVSECLPQI